MSRDRRWLVWVVALGAMASSACAPAYGRGAWVEIGAAYHYDDYDDHYDRGDLRRAQERYERDVYRARERYQRDVFKAEQRFAHDRWKNYGRALRRYERDLDRAERRYREDIARAARRYDRDRRRARGHRHD